jgi:hypothetical protein
VQEGRDDFQKKFPVNESKIFSRESVREESSWFDNRRGKKVIIDR